MPTPTLLPALSRQLHIFSVLRLRDFRIYWGSLFFQVNGQMMLRFTLGWLAFDITGSPLFLGYVNLIQALPAIVLNLVGGVVADRFDQRAVLSWIQLVLAVVIGGLAAATITGNVQPWHLMVVAFFVGATQSLDSPSRSAMLPSLLPDRAALTEAITVFAAVWQINQMMAPAIAGFIIAWWGPGETFLLCTVTFVIMIAGLRLISPRPVAKAASRNPLAAMAEGASYVWRHPAFRPLVGLNFIAAIFGFSFVFLLPVFAEDVLHVDSRGLGFLTAASGAGSVASVLVTPILIRRLQLGQTMFLQIGLFSAALAAFALSTSYALSLALMAIIGLCSFSYIITTDISIQTFVPDHLRGRVMGLLLMRWNLVPLGTFLVASAADVMASPGVAVALAAGVVAVATAIVAAVYKDLRSLRTPAASEAATAER